MTEYSVALLIVVWIPLIVVWAVVLVDVARRPDLGAPAKTLWVLSCTLVWPALIVYLMLRPTRGLLEEAEKRGDPHVQLVNAALLHEAGGLTDAEMQAIVGELRAR